MRLHSIPADSVVAAWPVVDRMIAASCRRSLGDLTSDGLRDLCAARQARLLIAGSDAHILMAGVVSLASAPGGPLICHILACGGSRIAEWRHLEPELEAWARHHKAGSLWFVGRLGWKRYLDPIGFECVPTGSGKAVFSKSLPPTAEPA